MKKIIEHAVGSRFEVDKIIYEVQLAESCVGCTCLIEERCIDIALNLFGFCSMDLRSDNNNVIFVQVSEVDEKK